MKYEKNYVSPELEILILDEDVVSTSDPIGGGDDNELPVRPILFD